MNNFSTVNTIKALTLLELPDNTEITQEMIKSNYRKLCLIYHPDQANPRYKDGGKFLQLKEAQEYLVENLTAVNNQIQSSFQNESYDTEPGTKRREDAPQKAGEEQAHRKADEEYMNEEARKADEIRQAEVRRMAEKIKAERAQHAEEYKHQEEIFRRSKEIHEEHVRSEAKMKEIKETRINNVIDVVKFIIISIFIILIALVLSHLK